MTLRPFQPFRDKPAPPALFSDPRAGKTNLLTSINLNDAYWQKQTTTIGALVAGGPDGTDACSALATGSNSFIRNAVTLAVPAGTHSFGAYVYVPSGFSCVTPLAMYLGTGAVLVSIPWANNQGSWVLLEGEFAGGNAANYRLTFGGGGTFTTGEKFMIWKPMVYTGNKVS